MATRKRAGRRSGIVGRAVSAGRRALREAEKRVPPDVRRQVERRLKYADKTVRAAIKQLQTQAKKASTRADVNSVLKRIDGLTKQARQVARGTGARAATTHRPAQGRLATKGGGFAVHDPIDHPSRARAKATHGAAERARHGDAGHTNGRDRGHRDHRALERAEDLHSAQEHSS